jgi:hypothetical protein
LVSRAGQGPLCGFLMRTSTRSVFLRYSRIVSVTSRTAVYGPVRTVVWQGSAGDRRPYANHWGGRGPPGLTSRLTVTAAASPRSSEARLSICKLSSVELAIWRTGIWGRRSFRMAQNNRPISSAEARSELRRLNHFFFRSRLSYSLASARPRQFQRSSRVLLVFGGGQCDNRVTGEPPRPTCTRAPKRAEVGRLSASSAHDQ